MVDYFILTALKLCSNEYGKSCVILFATEMIKCPHCLGVGLTFTVYKSIFRTQDPDRKVRGEGSDWPVLLIL